MLSRHWSRKLPEDIVELGHEETLFTNGLCRVRVIRKLTDVKLESLGISMGDVMMILDVLHAKQPPGQPAAGVGERI